MQTEHPLTPYEKQEEAPFNMAMLYYLELHRLREVRVKALLNKDIEFYKDCLELIYIDLSFKLSREERTLVELDFQDVEKLFANYGKGKSAENVMTINLQQAKKKLKKIDMKLMNLMHKYRMIFPNFEFDKGLEALDKRFNLIGDN